MGTIVDFLLPIVNLKSGMETWLGSNRKSAFTNQQFLLRTPEQSAHPDEEHGSNDRDKDRSDKSASVDAQQAE